MPAIPHHVFCKGGLCAIDRRWRNGTLFGSGPRIDWSEQVVVITGGSWCPKRSLFPTSHHISPGAGGIGGLLANTLAIRGVTVAVMDVVPLVTENRG